MNLTKLIQGRNLTENERMVLAYLMEHLDTALSQGVRSIAQENYTSTSTIMRLARKLGYSGFVDMCYNLRAMAEEPERAMAKEQDFLTEFCQSSILSYDTYANLKVFTKHMVHSKGGLIFIYATGFSATIGTYMARKLVNMGLRCMFAAGKILLVCLRTIWNRWEAFSAFPNPVKRHLYGIRLRLPRKTVFLLRRLRASGKTASAGSLMYGSGWRIYVNLTI